MKRACRRWATVFLAALLTILLLCGCIVYLVDPCLYWRLPEGRQPVFFNERYQAAGLVRNVQADTILLGTSMTANYRASHIADAFGGTALRIVIPDGYYSEFDQILELAFRTRTPDRILFGVDFNALTRDESGKTDALPEYLYDDSPINDGQYLFSKDALYFSLYSLLGEVLGQGQSLDEGFTWDAEKLWDGAAVCRLYLQDRADVVDSPLPEDAFLENTRQNTAILKKWVEAHPETEFSFFLTPGSILFWDDAIRTGRLDALLAGVEFFVREMSDADNVCLYGFSFQEDIVTNLDNYCDYIHHSGTVCDLLLEEMAAGEQVLTAETLPETLAHWRQFLEDFDFDALLSAS